MSKTFYVDVDGTLLSSELDNRFKASIEKIGFDETVTWYKSCEIDNLSINYSLVSHLIYLKLQGHKLILWTNRGEENIPMTKRNLGYIWYLFDEHQFFAGTKGKCSLNGVIYDNEEKYLSCGAEGKLYKF